MDVGLIIIQDAELKIITLKKI